MKSLNPIPSIIRYVELIDLYKADCKVLRQVMGFNLSFNDWIKYTKTDVDKHVQKPVDRVKYYQRVKRHKAGVYLR